MRKSFILALCCIALASISSTSFADVILAVELAPADAGAPVDVDVFATSTVNDAVTSFDIPLIISDVNNLLTFTSADFDPAFNVNNFDGGSASGASFGAGLGLIAGEQTRLFTLTFDVNGSAGPGSTVPISINQAGAFELVTAGGGATIGTTPGAVAVVPEPSGLALLAIGFCGMAARRRRARA